MEHIPECRLEPSPGPRHFLDIRILVVEDHNDYADLVGLMIRDRLGEACEIVYAASLGEAIEKLDQNSVDLIILDLGLPDLSGYKCQLVLNQVVPGIPVIILTSDERRATRDLAALCGARTYLLKNEIDAGVLATTIQKALAQHRDQ